MGEWWRRVKQQWGCPPERVQAVRPLDSGLRERVPAAPRWRHEGSPSSRALEQLYNGKRPEPIPARRGPLEDPVAPAADGAIGICCSGGGIRSAAYNLGALQVLQGKNELKRARYLSAVSGGSYIASAFAMVANTKTHNRDGTPAENSDAALFAKPKPDSWKPESAPFAPGTPEEQYLRDRCSYLAPDGMAKLFLAYRVLLGLIFNVLFIALPVFAATMLLGVLAYRHAFPWLVGACSSGKSCKHSVDLPRWTWIAPLAFLAPSLALGFFALLRRSNHDERLRAMQVWSTRLLVLAGAVATVTLLLPVLVSLLHKHLPAHVTAAGEVTTTTKAGSKPAGASTTAPVVGASGFLVVVAGVLAHLRDLFGKGEEVVGKLKGLPVRARNALAYTAALLAGPVLLLAAMVSALSLTLGKSVGEDERWWLIGGGAGGIVLFGLIYYLIDLTALSLHPFYKRRLCTAFALRRVKLPLGDRVATTDQESDEGTAVERLYDDHVKLSDTALDDDGAWPTLLVCAAANVSDPGATPPGRRVTSFTFSAHTIGGPLIGGIETRAFEAALDGNRKRSRDLTLPAAVAMSGAAVAPSMGKKTRRPLTFLTALANVRLGVWLPNPRWVAETDRKPWSGVVRSRPRPSYLLRELLGRNRVDGKYLFVTDGGHYENLGLVELLRRGCTEIYCVDASGGSTFEELGDAVALARSELGVNVEIDPTPLEPTTKKGTGADTPKDGEPPPQNVEVAAKDVVCGKFTYADGTPGRLVYARNVMTAQAPFDVQAHHRADPVFPHDSTMDQLYTDQKFESYRVLGQLAGEHAVAAMEKARAAA